MSEETESVSRKKIIKTKARIRHSPEIINKTNMRVNRKYSRQKKFIKNSFPVYFPELGGMLP